MVGCPRGRAWFQPWAGDLNATLNPWFSLESIHVAGSYWGCLNYVKCIRHMNRRRGPPRTPFVLSSGVDHLHSEPSQSADVEPLEGRHLCRLHGALAMTGSIRLWPRCVSRGT